MPNVQNMPMRISLVSVICRVPGKHYSSLHIKREIDDPAIPSWTNRFKSYFKGKSCDYKQIELDKLRGWLAIMDFRIEPRPPTIALHQAESFIEVFYFDDLKEPRIRFLIQDD